MLTTHGIRPAARPSVLERLAVESSRVQLYWQRLYGAVADVYAEVTAIGGV